VVIAFWSSRCNPCRDTLKELNALNANWSTAGLAVIGVNVDDDVQKARDYAGSLTVSFPMLLDPAKQVARAYRIEALPYVVVVDRDSKVRMVRQDEKKRPAPGQDFSSRLRRLLDE
jgi:peroxiredoxin